MEKEISIREWKENWDKGVYSFSDVKTQINAGWYDWWCRDTSLYNKTKRMSTIIMKLKDSEKSYVFFKNNCPFNGALYDSLKICDIENRDVIFCINMDDENEELRYTVYGKENKFQKPLFASRTIKELVDYLNKQDF